MKHLSQKYQSQHENVQTMPEKLDNTPLALRKPTSLLSETRKLRQYSKNLLVDTSPEKLKTRLSHQQLPEYKQSRQLPPQRPFSKPAVVQHIHKKESPILQKEKNLSLPAIKQSHKSPLPPKMNETTDNAHVFSSFRFKKTSDTSKDIYNIYGLEDYNIQSFIGKGAFAKVIMGINKFSKQKVAIKVYDKWRLQDPQRKKNVMNEIQVLRVIDNQHCIQLIDQIETPKQINIIMKYGGNKSLFQYLKSKANKRLQESEVKRIFKQLILGIQYIHSNNVLHRDLKLDNILFDDNNDVKIIDFGFAVKCDPNHKLTALCGTSSYMAPEIIQRKEYLGQPVDIWACGIVLYVLLSGGFPFKGPNEQRLFERIKSGEFTVPNWISGKCKELIKKILIKNPNERLTANQILIDPWFSRDY